MPGTAISHRNFPNGTNSPTPIDGANGHHDDDGADGRDVNDDQDGQNDTVDNGDTLQGDEKPPQIDGVPDHFGAPLLDDQPLTDEFGDRLVGEYGSSSSAFHGQAPMTDADIDGSYGIPDLERSRMRYGIGMVDGSTMIETHTEEHWHG
jgi:hypothetical protein